MKTVFIRDNEEQITSIMNEAKQLMFFNNRLSIELALAFIMETTLKTTLKRIEHYEDDILIDSYEIHPNGEHINEIEYINQLEYH